MRDKKNKQCECEYRLNLPAANGIQSKEHFMKQEIHPIGLQRGGLKPAVSFKRSVNNRRADLSFLFLKYSDVEALDAAASY